MKSSLKSEKMSDNAEARTSSNGNHVPAKPDTFRYTSRFIHKFMTQKTFDVVCMLLAEVLGTGTLMFLGCAGTVNWNGPPPGLQPPLNFGLTVMFIIQIFGHISYAILNPAVAICAVINNLISVKVKLEFPSVRSVKVQV
jgi:hypothetical protein